MGIQSVEGHRMSRRERGELSDVLERLGPAAGWRGTVVSLRTDQGPVSLDLWEGDTQGRELDQCRTLSIAASVLGLELRRLS